jgi:hypothetical protein
MNCPSWASSQTTESPQKTSLGYRTFRLPEQLRAKRKGQAGRSWYVDETYIRVGGQWH